MLVLGAAGRTGRYILRALNVDEGLRVTALDIRPDAELAALYPQIRFICGDVLSMARSLVAASNIPYTLLRCPNIYDGENAQYDLTTERQQPRNRDVERAAIARCIADTQQLATLQGFGRNDGAPVFVMVSTIASTALNIFLDWLFVFPLKMSIAGAAIATGISQTVGLAIVIIHFLMKCGHLHFSKFKTFAFVPVSSLYLETHSRLSTAMNLYEKLGFRPIERPEAVVHGTMDHFYVKKL